MASAGCSSGYLNESNKTHYYPMEMEQQQPPRPRKHLLPRLLLGGGCFLLLMVIFVGLIAHDGTGMNSANGTSNTPEHRLVKGSLFPELNPPEQSDANLKSTFKEEPLSIGSTIEPGQVDDSTRKSEDSANTHANILYEDFCPRVNDKTFNYKKNDKIYFSNDSEINERIMFQSSFSGSIINQANIKLKPRKVILTLSLLDNNDIGKCSNSKLKHFDDVCEFTTEISRFQEADVVIFREKDLKSDFLNKRNQTDQLWIYNNPSPLQASSSLSPEKNISNIFNLTGTYDFNSHLPMLPMYWSKHATKNEWAYKEKTTTDNQLRVTVFNEDCSEEEIFLKKYRNVIEALESNGVIVDWFGNCTNSKNHQSDCNNLSSAECYETISTKSKFALAFETAEVDFISERFFDPLRNYIVPIVIGKSTRAKYKALSPENSFIDYCDFKTVSDLTKHLKQLNTDGNQYKKFFLYKGVFKTRNRWYCQVCGMLFRNEN